MEDYEQYDGLGLARLVRQGEITPEELLEAAVVQSTARLVEPCRQEEVLGAISPPLRVGREKGN
jgi:hypothetical protein